MLVKVESGFQEFAFEVGVLGFSEWVWMSRISSDTFNTKEVWLIGQKSFANSCPRLPTFGMKIQPVHLSKTLARTPKRFISRKSQLATAKWGDGSEIIWLGRGAFLLLKQFWRRLFTWFFYSLGFRSSWWIVEKFASLNIPQFPSRFWLLSVWLQFPYKLNTRNSFQGA